MVSGVMFAGVRLDIVVAVLETGAIVVGVGRNDGLGFASVVIAAAVAVAHARVRAGIGAHCDRP